MGLARTIAGIAVFATVAGAVFAETPHDLREAHMKAQAAELGALGAMAQDKAPYDAAAAVAAAERLAALAAKDWTDLFPAGSTDHPENRALPVIWENPEAFMLRHKDLSDAAANLAKVAGTGLDALKAGFGPVGAACGACHRDFRKPE